MPSRVVVQGFPDGRNWVVQQPVVYPVGDSGHVIIVPAGFVTDFASVPRALWSVFPSTGPYSTAAAVHDFLYWDQACTRHEADLGFRLAMFETHVAEGTRETLYRAVEVGGKPAWEHNAQDKAAGLVKVVPMGPGGPEPALGVDDTWEGYRAKLPRSPPGGSASAPPAYCAAIVSEATRRGIGP